MGFNKESRVLMTLENRKIVEEVIAEERRLAVLCLLKGPFNGAVNERLLLNVLRGIGLPSSRESVRACLDSLEKIGSIKIDWQGALAVAWLTSRGEEIARGLVEVEGVSKPKVDCVYWDLK